MSQERRRGSGSGSGGGGANRGKDFRRKPKACAFCTDKNNAIDYKKPDQLRRYLTERGKIRPRRQTGACARHQRAIAVAIKRARHLALLPFTAAHIRGD